MKVLVAGATGVIGRQLVPLLDAVADALDGPAVREAVGRVAPDAVDPGRGAGHDARMRSPATNRARRVPAEVTRRRAIVPLLVLFVAAPLVVGCGGDEALPAVDGPTSPRLEVTATDMAYDPDAVAVAAGTVEVVLHNEGQVLHDLRVSEQPFIVEAGAGETTTGQLTLDAGSYAFYCSLPGHREAGMEGVIEVR